ncbi:MAG: helix-turn-helix domain-containing protein [Christensenellales bacterium]|jgi:AcrR family transcriptional regulator
MARTNTKTNIFNAAVKLFAQKGYNVVTVREIAAAAKANEGVIYYHYKNKEDILNDIFNAFEKKLEACQLTENEADASILTDTSPRQLLERCTQVFHNDDAVFMLHAYRIVCMEQFSNERAMRLVSRVLHDKTAMRFKYVLDKLIEHEKIPSFDTQSFSVMWTDFMFSRTMKYANHLFEDEVEEPQMDDLNHLGSFWIEMVVSGKIPDERMQMTL